MNNLVHFFGPDGSGKTTQADAIVLFLNNRGMKARKIWLRSPHTLAFLLWRFFIKIGFYRRVPNAFGVQYKYPAVNQSKGLSRLWVFLEFVSVLPHILRVRLLVYSGYSLVAERYILDTVTTVAYFIDDPSFLNSRTAQLLYRFIPRNTLFVFLDSDYETIFQRRAGFFGSQDLEVQGREYGRIPRGAVEPREFLDFQRTAYRTLAKLFGALQIDTSLSSIEETHSIIVSHLHDGK